MAILILNRFPAHLVKFTEWFASLPKVSPIVKTKLGPK
jgi:hypothetical protein